MIRDLKTWPEPFQAIVDGRKLFEIRRADRPFKVGDRLRLREYEPEPSGFTGREAIVAVTYLVAPGEWGLPADLCVMGISRPWRRGGR